MSNTHCLELGKAVDVLSENENAWHIATIVDFYKDQIKIHYDCDDDSDLDEWIHINQTLPIHTNTLHSIPLNIPPNDVVISNKKSNLIFSQKAHCLFLITLNQNGTKTIYQYNILANHWDNVSNFVSKTTSIDSIAIDEEKDLLYIFGTGYNNYGPILQIYDIKKMIITYSNHIDCMALCNIFNPHLCCVPSDQLHLICTTNFQNTNHFLVSRNSPTTAINASVLCSNLAFEPIFTTFCEQTKQLIAINNFGEIFCCELRNGVAFAWNRFEIDIEHDIDACFAFLTYNHFLMMFVLLYDECLDRYCHEIWFVDLVEHKIFKSRKNAPEIIFEHSFLGTIDAKMNALHLILQEDDNEQIQHFKLYLGDIIPYEMIRFYQQKHYKQLIYSYVAEINTMQSKPFDIVDLLLSFYPPFL